MKEFTNILCAATAAISPAYFRVDVADSDPVYRERVYCYELYHQMRLRWPMQCNFTLNGELDKAAHPFFTNLGAGSPKPDFLIHRPGSMCEGSNHAIIEVKRADAQSPDIKSDLQKLDQFVRAIQYQRAIYLFFGHDADCNLVSRIQTVALEFKELSPIELWLHQLQGEPAMLRVKLGKQCSV